jgi:hypothetical protein
MLSYYHLLSLIIFYIIKHNNKINKSEPIIFRWELLLNFQDSQYNFY